MSHAAPANQSITVHTTRGEELRLEWSVIEGEPLVTVFGDVFREGLVDLGPKASQELGFALQQFASRAAVSAVQGDTRHTEEESAHVADSCSSPGPQIAAL